MSGVPERLRHVSGFDFYSEAIVIRKKVLKLVVSPAIPKSYRFIFSVPLAETARKLVSDIVTSDAFYPNTTANVIERKKYLTLAISDCELLLQDFQTLIEMELPIKASRFESITEEITQEISRLKGARQGVKLIV